MKLPEKDFFEEIEIDGLPDDQFLKEIEEETKQYIPTENTDSDEFNVFEEIQPEKEPEAEPPKRIFSYLEEAEQYVELFSGTQEIALPKLYNSVLFTPVEREKLKKALNKLNTNVAIDNDEESELITRYDSLKELITNIPLTEHEKNKIVKPLSKCLEIWKSVPSPTFALLCAIFMVEIPRILPLIQHKLFTKK